jgi:methylmalonyl-CoA mutase N-terminal domain/subunit
MAMTTQPAVPTTEAQRREASALGGERDVPFATLSGLPVKPLYTEADLPDAGEIGVPGDYPFTRGVYRGRAAVQATLSALKQTAAREDANLMPGRLDAARAHATEGEIGEALQEVFGSYTETPVF